MITTMMNKNMMLNYINLQIIYKMICNLMMMWNGTQIMMKIISININQIMSYQMNNIKRMMKNKMIKIIGTKKK